MQHRSAMTPSLIAEDLPHSIVATIFSSWICFVDVVRVDSAYCCTHRPSFLRAAYSENTTYQYPAGLDCVQQDTINAWILTRGVSIRYLKVTSCMVQAPNLLQTYLHATGKTILSVTFPVEYYVGSIAWKPVAIAFATFCPNLRRLENVSFQDTETWEKFSTCCPALEGITSAFVTNSSVEIIARRCLRLREIAFSRWVQITDSLILVLCLNARNLRHLVHVSSNSQPFTDTTIRTLALHCQHITTLEVSAREMTDASVYALAEHCRQLHTLTLRESASISGRALVHLSSVCNMRKFAFERLARITSDDLEQILLSAPDLRSLSMSHPPQRMEYRYERIGDLCPALCELEIISDRTVTPGCLQRMSQHCPDLHKLVLVGDSSSTGEDLRAVLLCCPRLTYLDLSNCKAVDDAVLNIISKHCLLLQVLIVRGLPGITDAGVLAVVQASPQLRSLNVQHSPRITNAGLAAVQAARPCLCASFPYCERWLGERVAVCDLFF